MFFVGCEEEEENANLDSNLFGAWKSHMPTINHSDPFGPLIPMDVWVSFDQDGTCSGPLNVVGGGSPYAGWHNNNGANWWIEGDMLMFDYGDDIYGDDIEIVEWQYDVLGDTLRQYIESPAILYIEEFDNWVLQEGPPYYYDWLKQWD